MTQTQTIYNYLPQTGEFVSDSEADASPLEPGVFLIPAFATTTKPPIKADHEIPVFSDGQWHLQADWRNVALYNTTDGSTVYISEIGKTPADLQATDQPRPTPAHVWKDGVWVLDTALQAQHFADAKDKALVEIDNARAQAVQTLVRHPTQVEKDSWALKIETARALIDHTTLTPASQAFLEKTGMNEEEQQKWAASVKTKFCEYADILGRTEKLRETARAAIKATTDEDMLKKVLAEQLEAIQGITIVRN